MLKSLRDRTGKPSKGPVRQGSLLDMLETVPSHQDTVVTFPISSLRGQGSLLNRIGEAEDAAARRRRIEESARLAEMAEEQRQSLQRESVRIEERPQASPVATLGRSENPQVSKQEQLDLLADQLNSLAGKPRRNRVDRSDNWNSYQSAARAEPLSSPQPRSLAAHFSFVSIVREVLYRKALVLLFAITGAVLAALYALSLPNTYESVAEILVEPRGIKVVDNAVTPNGFNGESTIAFAESQVRILTSSSVVDPVVADLELALDPEFNGEDGVTGIIGSLIGALFGSEPSEQNRVAAAREYLHDNLDVVRINQTFTILISVTTRDPAKSARIANAVAREYMQNEAGARSSAARSASEDLTGRLDELRAQVREAEERVESYKAENGLVDADGKLVSEVQLSRLNDQLALAQAQTGDARSRAELAASTDLSDVISGSLPTALATPTISQLRVQYSRAKSRLEKIATRLGPRHPERIGAESELRSARDAIASELSRIVQSAQSDYESARGRQAEIQSQVNVLKASAVTDSAAKVRLRELEREVAANRQVYEAFLLRSRETGEQENIRSTSARVISEAVPPTKKAGPNRKLIVAIGGMGGAALGALLALLPLVFGARRIFAEDRRISPQKQHSTPRSDDLYSAYDMPATMGVASRETPAPFQAPSTAHGSPAQESVASPPPPPVPEPAAVAATPHHAEPHQPETQPQPQFVPQAAQPPAQQQMPLPGFYPQPPAPPYAAPPMAYPSMGYGAPPAYPTYPAVSPYPYPQPAPASWMGYPAPPSSNGR